MNKEKGTNKTEKISTWFGIPSLSASGSHSSPNLSLSASAWVQLNKTLQLLSQVQSIFDSIERVI